MSDSQVAFSTRLQLPTHNGTELMMFKIDPGAQVYTIPPAGTANSSPIKQMIPGSPNPIPCPPQPLPGYHMMVSLSPFLGHSVTEVKHASEPRSYLTCFYVFKDATSPQILLSYATSERLGFITFKVPNLTATSQVDDLSNPTSPTPSGMGKTAKCVTFCDPLVDTTKPYSIAYSPTSCSHMRKTASLKVCFGNTSIIQGAKHKSPPSTPVKSILRPAFVYHLCHKAMGPTKSALKVESPRATSPYSTAQVQDIMTLKRAFPNSFDTIGNISGVYTISTDPIVLPVQYTGKRYPSNRENRSNT